MKKPKRKKPKFRVGEVVTMAGDTSGYLFRVVASKRTGDGGYQYADDTYWYDESDLRPLNRVEIGPRRK